MIRPVLLIVTLASVAVAGAAGAAPGREAHADYTGTTYIAPAGSVYAVGQTVPVGGSSGGSVYVAGHKTGSETFDVKAGERSVGVSLADRSGHTVGATASQVRNGRTVRLGSFCGHSARLSLRGSGALTVTPAVVAGCEAPATIGTITVDFAR
jgi:hypothetical protein